MEKTARICELCYCKQRKLIKLMLFLLIKVSFKIVCNTYVHSALSYSFMFKFNLIYCLHMFELKAIGYV